MKKGNPYFKTYSGCVCGIIMLGIVLLFNICRISWVLDGRRFWAFSADDWLSFWRFVVEELGLLAVMFTLIRLARKMSSLSEAKDGEEWEKIRFEGIYIDDYEFIWFDYDQVERALVKKNENGYVLSVHAFNEIESEWIRFDEETYDSLDALKTALFYDYDFYFEGNAELDKHGEAIFKL